MSILERPSCPKDALPAGYAALQRRYELAVLPHHRSSFLATRGARRELRDGRSVLRMPYLDPAAMSDVEHLLFALKHDGLHLGFLSALFNTVNAEAFERELTAAVQSKPAGRYHRKLWFLYEWLTGRKLPLDDARTTNYVPVLNPTEYFAGPPRRSRRHRVVNNLLGTRQFCPTVRRTEVLAHKQPSDLAEEIRCIVSTYDEDILSRALSYLYTKETMSSFAIERERPKPSRAERFAALLKRVDSISSMNKEVLLELQAAVVESRFAEHDFRGLQNYVGESIGLHSQKVHFVPPVPDDVPALMQGWFDALHLTDSDDVDPVPWAAAMSFGFVFIHPFVDGNGRLHRFLIHYLLARRGVTPSGVVIPVSAIMLARRREYDACLEQFSRPLMELIDYDLQEEGWLKASGNAADHYRFFDATPMAEALYGWLEEAVRGELRAELDFLVGLQATRKHMAEVVDLPDRLVDLFVKLCLGNGGTVSGRKRASYFSMLTDEEVAALEEIVRREMPSRRVASQ